MERKQDIRKELLKKRNSLPEEQREKYSKLIAERLFSLKEYKNVDTLLIYISYQSEVSTYEIIEQALNTGKRVFCPRVLGPGIMEFYEIISLEDVVCGYKNIPEPKHTDILYRNTDSSDTLVLMPLVGFDSYKNRLGYGSGFYDRYLRRFPDIAKIALAFECQKSKCIIPAEETDVKPDFIITENTVF